MTKQIINVGSPPGNLGDGDSLRDAFIKTQANFDELYAIVPVTDTSLPDHSDPGVDGTIAKALAQAEAAGGGTVLVGPGVFKIANALLLGTNVVLKGVGRRASIITMTGSDDNIKMLKQFSAVESLKIQMPVTGVTSNGISISKGDTHVKDVAIAGGGPSSWGISVDAASVTYFSNIKIGGTGNKFLGNGIIFENPSYIPVNFGDSKLSHVDILLEANNTTGLKFHGPDSSANKINNILCSQLVVVGTGSLGGCTGVHISNASRIVFITVDLENLGVAVREEGGGSGSSSKNNVYIATFVFGTGVSYESSGNVSNRLFLGCDNLTPENTGDSDTVIPQAIWLNNGASRIWSSDSYLHIDDGNSTKGLQIGFNTSDPVIRPVSSSIGAKLTLGKLGTRGVECSPGVVLSPQGSPPPSPVEGMLVYYSSGVVGSARGLYQYRGSSWTFIG